MNGEISKLARYGPTGVNIALIILIAFIVNLFVGSVNEHMDKNTDAINRLDITISSKSVQADLYAVMNGGHSTTTSLNTK